MSTVGVEGLEVERAKQRFIASLSAREKVAFILGGHIAKGGVFPSDEKLDELRRRCGDDRAALCRTCKSPLPLRPAGKRGRPPTRCDECRSQPTPKVVPIR